MSSNERRQPLLILLSATVGLIISPVESLTQFAESSITPLLIAVLYAIFLPIPLQQFKRAFRHRSVTLISLTVNFIWTPLFTWGLGIVFLADIPDLRLGLLMLLVTPCTDWYLVFTGIAKGDVALGTALLPLNAILQLVLLPIYLWGLGGSLVNLAPKPLLMSIIFVFLLPLGLAILTREMLGKKWDEESWHIFLKRMETGQIVALNGAIVAIFIAEGNVILQQPTILLRLFPPLALFYSLNFVLIQGLSRLFQFSYPQLACLTCTTLARNSPVAIAIASSVFPHRPLISLALVVGALIELPILGLVSQRLLKQEQTKN